MDLADFNYHLPPEKIAQTPLAQRDQSKLLVLHQETGQIEHRRFTDIVEYLRPGDMVVANNSKVLPARLYGRKSTGAHVELLLLEQLTPTRWKVLVGGKRVNPGVVITLLNHQQEASAVTGTVMEKLEGAQRLVEFNQPALDWLEELGHTPLPPYIHEKLNNQERYQTIYARPAGSAAAPTAGLHFTPELLFTLRERGVLFETVTLHVGLDTFKPVEVSKIQDHTIHQEWATVTPETAQRINEAKLEGGRLVAVGTTSLRTLETAALRSAGIAGPLQTISQRDAAGETSLFCPWKPVASFAGSTDLYIYPGYKFRAVDMLITNFHIPQSTLLMLVSAFTGRGKLFSAYEEALQHNYRFLSFGDAMLIV